MNIRTVITNQFPEAADHVIEQLGRNHRDALLAASDWTQHLDAPVDRAAWAAYRQALRDLPQAADWPDVEIPNPPGYIEPTPEPEPTPEEETPEE